MDSSKQAPEKPNIVTNACSVLQAIQSKDFGKHYIQGDPKKTEPNSNYSKYTGSVFFGSPCIIKNFTFASPFDCLWFHCPFSLGS